MSKLTTPREAPSFAALVQIFFAEHLKQQRAMSPRTVATYRDAFVLFLNFAERQLHKQPTEIQLAQITPALILDFLDYLEHDRGNTIRSRNARLAALRAFLKFAAHRDVSALRVVEQALGVPMKRFERPMLGFLSRDEMLAIIGVRLADVVLNGTAFVTLHGKGRKQRTVPLWRSTVKAIRSWLRLNPELASASSLLPNRAGQPMTRNNVTQRLDLAVKAASSVHPRLVDRHVSPHMIRHTTAMHLLQSGVDISVIALWLGHESPTTTHQYVEADLAMKERALARLHEPDIAIRRYQAPDSLLEFLKTL